jgi:hypothetical protein
MSDSERLRACSTCKHWVDLRKLENDPREYGLCAKGDFNTPELPGEADPDTLMWGNDASDFKARVCTMPNFGCVMHEPGVCQDPRPDDWDTRDQRRGK